MLRRHGRIPQTLRVSLKRAYDRTFAIVPLHGNSFFFGFVDRSDATWNKFSNDKCARKSGGGTRGSQSK